MGSRGQCLSHVLDGSLQEPCPLPPWPLLGAPGTAITRLLGCQHVASSRPPGALLYGAQKCGLSRGPLEPDWLPAQWLHKAVTRQQEVPEASSKSSQCKHLAWRQEPEKGDAGMEVGEAENRWWGGGGQDRVSDRRGWRSGGGAEV